MKYLIITFLAISLSNVSLAASEIENEILQQFKENKNTAKKDPFFDDFLKSKDGDNAVLMKGLLTYSDPQHAEQFFNNHHKIYEHMDNIKIVILYLNYLESYLDNYDSDQIDILFTPIFQYFEKTEFTDDMLRGNEYFGSGFKAKINSVFFKLYRKKSIQKQQQKRMAEALIQRKKYFENKFSGKFIEHPYIIELNEFVDNGFSNQIKEVALLEDVKAAWSSSTTNQRNHFLDQLEVNLESNQWVNSLLETKQNKETTKSILEFLLSNINEIPENKHSVLKFIGDNQRFPYIRIANEYLGEDQVDAYLELIDQ
ncbi:hypothetical protein [Marinicellulosiphila megalodicopiae]|uniref:hypothetical protein n=1 Tax=Marinicellulosiphila megalodicopiae TaxID=2724896 RepID=UPI003BB049CE